MKTVKVQTQLSFEKHSGNTKEFQEAQQNQFTSKTLADCHRCLRSVFRLQEFRGQQMEIVKAVLKGRDVLVIMPTGGGKSLCYQLPALISKGLTIVVSPLLALIQDQCNALLRLGVKAAALNSSVGKTERAKVMTDLGLSIPTIKLLYVTPELLATSEFRKHIAALESRGALARLVIDEAHCISEWGHDFRKDYAKLDYIRIAFPKIPIVALTATATERVRQDIKKTLGLPNPPELGLFMSSFNRENLYYEVRYDNDDRYENFLGFLRGVYKSRIRRLQAGQNAGFTPGFASSSTALSSTPSSRTIPKRDTKEPGDSKVEPVCGIIYCGQRLMCEDLAARLLGDGIKAAAFHSGMTPKQRDIVQRRWCSGEVGNKAGDGPDTQPIDVIVATIAFGMGIDKPNVRFVCHWELPKTIEGYYQESGRAGRDGEISRCILYYSREDRGKIEFLLEMEKERRRLKRKKDAASSSRKKPAMDSIRQFEQMVAYCENTTKCRHVFLCEYFGESNVSKQVVCQDGARCDICRTPEKVAKEKAEKLSQLMVVGRQAQYMGGSKTFIGPDGAVQVQGSWHSASVALDRYDPDMMEDQDDEDELESSTSEDSDKDPIAVSSSSEKEDNDYDSEAERKAKRRKLLFGKAVDPSYYKKPDVASVQTPEVKEVIDKNKYGLEHVGSTKVPLNFREMCYETIERALSSLFQGSHKSLTAEYFSKLATYEAASSLSKAELDTRLTEFVKKLSVELERVGFETSGTVNIYKTVLGHRVRDIKAFEKQACTAIGSLSSQNLAASSESQSGAVNTKPANQAWATAVKLWANMP